MRKGPSISRFARIGCPDNKSEAPAPAPELQAEGSNEKKRPRLESRVSAKAEPDPEPGDLGQLLIPGNDEIHIRVRPRRRKDQSVGHSKRLEARPKLSCCVGNSKIDG